MPAIYAERDPRKLPQVFTDALSGLVAAESYCVAVRDRRRGDRVWHVRSACAGHDDLVPVFFQYINEFAPASYRAATGSGEAVALSDFVSSAQLEQLGVYREYYRRVGVEDDLNINVMLDDVVICASAMRSRRGFHREERELMNALRPHFRQAWSNAQACAKPAGAPRGVEWSSARLEAKLGLTPREAQVLLWLAQGKTNPEIAQILRIRPNTVRTHLDRVFTKLGVNNRHAGALCALEVLGF